MKLADLLRDGASSLEEARIPEARLTAEVLLAHVLGTRREFLYAHSDELAGLDAVHAYHDVLNRRIRREPLQYITGRQEFYGRTFLVDPSVLIPRPETELIVETVLALNRWESPAIVDVGTGSGCVAVTLALELAHARVYGTDVSVEALGTARRNAIRLGATVHLGCSDLLAALRGGFSFVVSNPPYVAPDELDGLQEEVVRHEPEIALTGSGEPMALYRTLIEQARELLLPGGWLVLEIGYTMAPTLRTLFTSGWSDPEDRCDLQGFPRVVLARRET